MVFVVTEAHGHVKCSRIVESHCGTALKSVYINYALKEKGTESVAKMLYGYALLLINHSNAQKLLSILKLY